MRAKGREQPKQTYVHLLQCQSCSPASQRLQTTTTKVSHQTHNPRSPEIGQGRRNLAHTNVYVGYHCFRTPDQIIKNTSRIYKNRRIRVSNRNRELSSWIGDSQSESRGIIALSPPPTALFLCARCAIVLPKGQVGTFCLVLYSRNNLADRFVSRER